tara:strand:+ start:16097 stop:17170 length:1074 start_codon:yes stop_codon:yes gene_type:complete
MTTLNKLLHQIHAIKNKAEMQSELSRFKTEIRDIVISGGFFRLYMEDEEENYFINHTGRELFRKLDSLGMQSEIKDSVDSGFRAIRQTKLSNLDLNFLARFDASNLSSIIHETETSMEANGNVVEVDKVKEWLDLTGNQNNVSRPNHTARQPSTNATTQNYLNVIDFDGNVSGVTSGDSLSKVGFKVPQSGNINFFIVFSTTMVDNEFDSIIALDSDNHDFQFDAANDTGFKGRISAKSVGGANTGIPNGQLSGFNIGHVFFNFDTEKYGLEINGEGRGKNRNYTAKLNETQELKIFSNRTGNNSPRGSIGEIIIVENLNQEQKKGIEGYLAHKWDLASKLRSDHPYKNHLYKFFDF